jgi:hypothetical protein
MVTGVEGPTEWGEANVSTCFGADIHGSRPEGAEMLGEEQGECGPVDPMLLFLEVPRTL